MQTRIQFFLIALLATLGMTAQQAMYVNRDSSYRVLPLSDAECIQVQGDSMVVGRFSAGLNDIDSLTFAAPDFTPTFLPQAMAERWSGTRVYSQLPALQQWAEQSPYNMQVSHMQHVGDSLFQLQYYPILQPVDIDFAALQLDGRTVEHVALMAADGTLLSSPFYYNCSQQVDTYADSTATGTLTKQGTGKSVYGVNSQSDVVVLTGIPDTCTCLRLYILPAQLKKGVILTIRLSDGTCLSHVDTEAWGNARHIEKRQYKLTPGNCQPTGAWMAMLPGNTFLRNITLPGTHDAATSSVSKSYSSMAKTQSLTIGEQLRQGVRAFDLRPRYNSRQEADIQLENLEIYHGTVATGVKFRDAMDTLIAYLDAHPTEAVVVNLQKESVNGTDYSATWRTSVRSYLQSHSGKFLRQLGADTKLADCRGKILLLSHNPYGSENVYNDIVYGGLVSWQDNASFATQINFTNNTKVCDAQVEDSYNASVSDKKKLVADNLRAASSDTSTRWYFTFLNIAWKLFGASIDANARDVNPYVLSLLGTEGYDGRLGVVFMDYAGSDTASGKELLQAIIGRNLDYLYK